MANGCTAASALPSSPFGRACAGHSGRRRLSPCPACPALLPLPALALGRLLLRHLHELLEEHGPRVDIDVLTHRRRWRFGLGCRRIRLEGCALPCPRPLGLLR